MTSAAVAIRYPSARAEANDQAERDRLFEQWEPLAKHVAVKLWAQPWIRRIGTLRDVEQDARIGLLKAIDGFDPEKPGAASFMSYAYRSIERYVQRRAQCAGIVRFPILKQIEGQVPPAVRQLPAEDGDRPWHDGLAAPGNDNDQVEAEDERELVRRLVDRLPRRLRCAVVLRFGLDGGRPRSLHAVAEEMKTTDHFVRRMLREAMERLTQRFENAERSRRMRRILESLGVS